LFINNNKIQQQCQQCTNKGEKNLWSDEQLHSAMEAVSSGELKAHAAAKHYGVPSSTLHDHIKGKSTSAPITTPVHHHSSSTVVYSLHATHSSV